MRYFAPDGVGDVLSPLERTSRVTARARRVPAGNHPAVGTGASQMWGRHAPPPKKLDADPDMGRWIARLALTLFDPHQPFANLPVCLSALVADRGCGQAV